MNLSDLQLKEVIDISTGRRIGLIIDVIVSNNGIIEKLVLEDKRSSRKFLSTTKEEINVAWNQIVKIGDDIILVDGTKERSIKK